ESFNEEPFVLLPVGLRPFGPRLFPRKLPPLLSLTPLVCADFLLHEVTDPIEGVGIHHRAAPRRALRSPKSVACGFYRCRSRAVKDTFSQRSNGVSLLRDNPPA